MHKFKKVGIILFVAVAVVVIYIAFFSKKDVVLEDEKSNLLLEDQVKTIMEKMSLDEKIGQLFLVRFSEEEIENDKNTILPAGYVLFAKDIEGKTPESLYEYLQSYQEQADVDLIFAVDEEGGTVTRVSRFQEFRFEPFKSVRDYYVEGGIDRLVQVEEEKINLLKKVGINLNLAPVADVSTNPDDFIYNRTLGEDVNIVSDYIKQIVRKAHELHFAITLKHFPGYGSNLDTHTGISVDSRSATELEQESLPPFEAGIAEEVPVIMFSHNIINCYDSLYPASLSKPVHDKLRDLGFKGLMITDDLAMDAIQKNYEGTAAVLAFLAGNDLIMTSSYTKDLDAIKQALENEQITEAEIDKRVYNTLSFKLQYGIIKET